MTELLNKSLQSVVNITGVPLNDQMNVNFIFLCFSLQFFLIAAYLSKSGDVEEWLKLAMMSLEQNNFGQALTCYNQGNLNH